MRYFCRVDCTLSFRKISPCWVIPYNILIRYFIYTRLVPTIRLYTNIFENNPLPCANPYIPSIGCNLILLIIHYHLKNIPLLSDSIQSIDQLFHLHQTCPFYQTIHYYFRKYPTPLWKSIHSIDQLQYDSIDYIPSFRKKIPLLIDPIQSIDQMFHLNITCTCYQTLHYYFWK